MHHTCYVYTLSYSAGRQKQVTRWWVEWATALISGRTRRQTVKDYGKMIHTNEGDKESEGQGENGRSYVGWACAKWECWCWNTPAATTKSAANKNIWYIPAWLSHLPCPDTPPITSFHHITGGVLMHSVPGMLWLLHLEQRDCERRQKTGMWPQIKQIWRKKRKNLPYFLWCRFFTSCFDSSVPRWHLEPFSAVSYCIFPVRWGTWPPNLWCDLPSDFSCLCYLTSWISQWNKPLIHRSDTFVCHDGAAAGDMHTNRNRPALTDT